MDRIRLRWPARPSCSFSVYAVRSLCALVSKTGSARYPYFIWLFRWAFWWPACWLLQPLPATASPICGKVPERGIRMSTLIRQTSAKKRAPQSGRQLNSHETVNVQTAAGVSGSYFFRMRPSGRGGVRPLVEGKGGRWTGEWIVGPVCGLYISVSEGRAGSREREEQVGIAGIGHKRTQRMQRAGSVFLWAERWTVHSKSFGAKIVLFPIGSVRGEK